jgi:IS5 family transposase
VQGELLNVVCNAVVKGTPIAQRKHSAKAVPQKKLCTPAPYRKLFVHWHEPARQAARALVGTPAYEHSRRARYKIEALFAELKQRMRLSRLRLRRLWNVGEQFLLAATAQNLKRLVRFLAQRPPKLEPQVS